MVGRRSEGYREFVGGFRVLKKSQTDLTPALSSEERGSCRPVAGNVGGFIRTEIGPQWRLVRRHEAEEAGGGGRREGEGHGGVGAGEEGAVGLPVGEVGGVLGLVDGVGGAEPA